MDIIRGTLDLESRIEALVRLQEEEDKTVAALTRPEAPPRGQGPAQGQTRRVPSGRGRTPGRHQAPAQVLPEAAALFPSNR